MNQTQEAMNETREMLVEMSRKPQWTRRRMWSKP